MMNSMIDHEEAMAAFEKEVLEQGIERGIEQGIERGIEQGRVESLRNLMRNLPLGADEAMDALGIPEADREALLATL